MKEDGTPLRSVLDSAHETASAAQTPRTTAATTRSEAVADFSP